MTENEYPEDYLKKKNSVFIDLTNEQVLSFCQRVGGNSGPKLLVWKWPGPLRGGEDRGIDINT